MHSRASAPGLCFVRIRLRMKPARLLLAPAFGAGIALIYLAGWVALDRVVTARAAAAAVVIGGAAALAAALALFAAFLLRRGPWTARFAASLIVLLAGTGGFATVTAGAYLAWVQHALLEIPVQIALLILALQIAAALYGFLALAAPLILPLGLPLAVLVALVAAGRPR
jgi:hypothetical protein